MVGFDLKQQRIEDLKKSIDRTGEVYDKDLENSPVLYTSNSRDIEGCNFIVVAVPTPIKKNKSPDLSPLLNASKIVGQNLHKGSTVVFESTVYPGATEEDCVPVLEKFSGLVFNRDFYCGYSPERINPGDKKHSLTKI